METQVTKKTMSTRIEGATDDRVVEGYNECPMTQIGRDPNGRFAMSKNNALPDRNADGNRIDDGLHERESGWSSQKVESFTADLRQFASQLVNLSPKAGGPPDNAIVDQL